MRTHSSLRPAVDWLVLAAILVVINLVLGGDPGWLDLNPTPYLLLPVLIGGKYGLRAGLAAGIGALGVTVGVALLGGVDAAVVQSSPLLLLAMPALGLVSGELQRQAAGRRDELERENAELQRAKGAFEKDVELAREAQFLLQKELALQGVDVCSLDVELRKIFEPGAAPVLEGTLAALAEIGGISDAAFYLREAGGEALERAAAIGDLAFFPESIDGRYSKMAGVAMAEGELVTCKGLGEGRPEIGSARFLAAVPWRRGGECAGVLLVRDMPFLAMNWQTLARVELVCDWVAAMEGVREFVGGEAHAAGRIGEMDVKAMLALVGKSASEHGLPSAVAVLAAAGSLTVGGLREALAAELRPTDVVVDVDDRGVAVLLPLEAGRDAARTAQRYGEALSASGHDAGLTLLTIDEAVEPEQLWEQIVAALDAS